MTWGLAQAGNRASKTGRYLQWWENRPEWGAMTSAVRNSRNSAHFIIRILANHFAEQASSSSATETAETTHTPRLWLVASLW